MRILYGVVGEGMGHAVRSRVVLEHLLGQGHEIEIMASGRAVSFLQRYFDDVNRIHGLHMVYDHNEVQARKTLWSNVRSSFRGVPHNIEAYFELISSFEPEVVISDFESWTHLYGQLHRLPTISVDNMQILNRCKHPAQIRKGIDTAFRLARAFVKAKLPGCEQYLVATFFSPPIRKKRTTLVAPILRPEILAAKRSQGEHLLVYQTGEGYEQLSDNLAKCGLPCHIYGMRRDLKEPQEEGNLRYMPFSEQGFIDDLASCRAVIAGGGFTLMGEAVYLHKPMLSVPLGGQVEQVVNARYLERLGYGMEAADVNAPAVIARFLEAVPGCQRALRSYKQDGNRLLFDGLDAALDKAAVGLL